MSFLSLSKGDPVARELLQRAIRARYGMRPVPVDSLRITMTRPEKGPLGLPAQLIVAIAYANGVHWRLETKQKLLGLTLAGITTSLAGNVYYERTGRMRTQSEDAKVIQGTRSLLWSYLCFSLTPLTADDIMVRSVDDNSFKAYRDSAPEITATVCLNPDDSVCIEADCYDPLTHQVSRLKMSGQGGLQILDGVAVPRQFVHQWGDKPPETLTVSSVVANPEIPAEEFVLKGAQPK